MNRSPKAKLLGSGSALATRSRSPDAWTSDRLGDSGLVEEQVEINGSAGGQGQRGAIIVAPFKARMNGTGGMDVEVVGWDRELIRNALLFVDCIDCPETGFFAAGRPPEEWRDTGLIKSSYILYRGASDAGVIEAMPRRILHEREKREPGRWSIWESQHRPVISSAELVDEAGFRLHVQKALIVPHRDVPVDDLLAFKTRRADELVAIRHYIEEICLKIASSGDPRVVNLEIEKFDQVLAEYTKAARESNWKKSLLDLKIDVNWLGVAQNIMQGSAIASVATLLQMPLASAALLGLTGLGAGLSLTSSFGLKDHNSTSPFRYLASIERELG
jgi:hypothetical protein